MQYKSRTSRLNGLVSLAYLGVLPSSPTNFIIKQTAPTPNDYRNVYVGDMWLNNASSYASPSTPPEVSDLYVLVSVDGHVATWQPFGLGSVQTLTSNSGGPVSPDDTDNINVLGDGVTITGVGTPVNNTITFSTIGTGVISSLTGNSGGAVFPTAGNTNIVGSGSISVVGSPSTSTLTISNSGAVAESFVTNSGTATPSAGVLNVVGTSPMSTSGSGNTVTIATAAAYTFPTGSGTATASGNAVTIAAGNGIVTTGSGSTVTVASTAGSSAFIADNDQYY